MHKETVIATLRRAAPELRAMGIKNLYLYGSVARGQAGPHSDVDLLLEPVDERFTIFHLIAAQDHCTKLLGCPAELHDYAGYERLTTFRTRIAPDLEQIF